MAKYIKSLGVYIADVPRVFFNRCDGRAFVLDELTSCTMTPQTNYLDVNAGWSSLPVAQLPGTTTMEMAITSGKFQLDLFEMSTGVNFAENATYEKPTVEHLTPSAEGKVVLAHVPVDTSISINGLEEVSSSTALTSGHYKVDPSDNTGKTIMFYMGDSTANPAVPGDVDTGTQIEIVYQYVVTANEAKFDNMETTMGEAIAEFPCYSSGDNCSSAAIVGYLYVRIFRCRATQKPGFDSSYKNASTFSLTLSAMDAKRDDRKAYSIAYIEA
jgi:hypothetical protein